MRIFGAGLWCQVCNLLWLFEGGAYLAMCVCAAVLRCHMHNLLLCGLFGEGGLFGHACLCHCTLVPHTQPLSLWNIWGANLAMCVSGARLQCHAHNLPLCGLLGGLIWPCMSVLPDLSATYATSVSVCHVGGPIWPWPCMYVHKFKVLFHLSFHFIPFLVSYMILFTVIHF